MTTWTSADDDKRYLNIRIDILTRANEMQKKARKRLEGEVATLKRENRDLRKRETV